MQSRSYKLLLRFSKIGPYISQCEAYGFGHEACSQQDHCKRNGERESMRRSKPLIVADVIIQEKSSLDRYQMHDSSDSTSSTGHCTSCRPFLSSHTARGID